MKGITALAWCERGDVVGDHALQKALTIPTREAKNIPL
jgi:hypothetical protein